VVVEDFVGAGESLVYGFMFPLQRGGGGYAALVGGRFGVVADYFEC
jgi:hypothetical protein